MSDLLQLALAAGPAFEVLGAIGEVDERLRQRLSNSTHVCHRASNAHLVPS